MMHEVPFERTIGRLTCTIIESRKSGVPSGHHLILTLGEEAPEPTPSEVGSLLEFLTEYAETHFSGREYRIEINSPALRGGKSRGWHAHLKVLGEHDELPRCVDPFVREGFKLVTETPRRS